MKSVPPTSYEPPPSAPPSYHEATAGYQYVYTQSHQNYNENFNGIITTVVPVGSESTHMICPNCHTEIETATLEKPRSMAYIFGALLCIFGCFCGCCLIPCCLKSFRETHHYCPNCNHYLGRFRL